ncbi:hypothetical protein J6590_017637 [Homalodisca vitripennis]|nr:hypothetical protein J6590_017637 [Homalodisca vitripennis]
MDDNGLVRIGDANQGSRKKPKTASIRTLAKLKRHGAPLGCRVFQPCKHLNKGVKCALVRPKDVLNTRQVLYKEAEKSKQDGIIASWDLTVSKRMFSKVFNEFNIGFRSPATDVCCTCYELDLNPFTARPQATLGASTANDICMSSCVDRQASVWERVATPPRHFAQFYTCLHYHLYFR